MEKLRHQELQVYRAPPCHSSHLLGTLSLSPPGPWEVGSPFYRWGDWSLEKSVNSPELGAGNPEPPPGGVPRPWRLSPQANPAPQPSFNLAQNAHIPPSLPKLPSASDNNSSRRKAQKTDAHCKECQVLNVSQLCGGLGGDLAWATSGAVTQTGWPAACVGAPRSGPGPRTASPRRPRAGLPGRLARSRCGDTLGRCCPSHAPAAFCIKPLALSTGPCCPLDCSEQQLTGTALSRNSALLPMK